LTVKLIVNPAPNRLRQMLAAPMSAGVRLVDDSGLRALVAAHELVSDARYLTVLSRRTSIRLHV
jgi:hypothetical protein